MVSFFVGSLAWVPLMAQAQADDWSTPINLSNSMAASQPSVVANPSGITQVFWMDRFDGLVTRSRTATGWSEPAPVPLGMNQQINPYIIADNSGWVHAFWSELDNQNPLFAPLYHSQMVIGDAAWSQPALIAEDALIFAVEPQASGGLELAYLRRAHTSSAPAGIYFRNKQPSGGSWDISRNVYKSIYYRLLNTGESSISLSDDSAGRIFIAWQDPFQGELLITESNDYGNTWLNASSFGDPQTIPTHPRLSAIPETTIGIWQTNAGGQCELFQQETSPSVVNITLSEPLTNTMTAASSWTDPHPIFPALNSCPVGDQFFPQPDKNVIYWVWGEGTNSLNLTIWENAKNGWTIPLAQSFTFEDPASGNSILLGDLQTAIARDQISVVGSDTNSDVWFTESNLSKFKLDEPLPPSWSQPKLISDANQNAKSPVISMDSSGNAHLVWVQPSPSGDLGAALFYSYWDPSSGDPDQFNAHTAPLPFSKPDELSRTPSLAVDEKNGLIHLAWVGGQNSEITVSRAPLDRASSPSEWFPSQVVSNLPYASSPRILVAPNNILYAIYAVPVNEDRGIYLVKSDDQGQTWTTVGSVYNAARDGAQAVDHPSLAIDPDGTLYAAWVETDRVGSGIPLGISFSYSTDAGTTWSEPMVLAGINSDLPQLALSGGYIHLLYSQLAQDGGLVWHRSILKEDLLTDNQAKWSSPEQVPGTEVVSLPFGVTTDGPPKDGVLHLVTGSPRDGSLSYHTWQDGVWSGSEEANLSKSSHPAAGLQAATNLRGGSLAVAWLINNIRNSNSQSNLYFSARSIPTQSVEIALEPTVTPTPVATIGPTPTVVKPTPTPDLNLKPPPGGYPQTPIILAGVLSIFLIGGFFAWRLLAARR